MTREDDSELDEGRVSSAFVSHGTSTTLRIIRRFRVSVSGSGPLSSCILEQATIPSIPPPTIIVLCTGYEISVSLPDVDIGMDNVGSSNRSASFSLVAL